jgi:hypothetical protein
MRFYTVIPKVIWVLFFVVGGKNLQAQCDSLNLGKIETMLIVADMLPHLTTVKFEFEKTSEDSLAYFYGRCPWESGGKCYAFKEYMVQSKSNAYYLRYQCYDLNTFTHLQKQIESIQKIQEVQGKEYRTIYDNFLVNYMQSPIEENSCGITQQYMIEFLRFK